MTKLTNSLQYSPDIFIIGGGPAGLATAIFAAQSGLRAVVADHRPPPLDKACGEGLMPDTLDLLQTLGIVIDPKVGLPFTGIRFNDAEGRTSAEAAFAKGFGLGLRRTVLHPKLAQRAAGLGVPLLWGARVTLQRDGQVFCDGHRVRSRCVIGADGEGSLVRKWAALDKVRYERIRFGARQHFGIVPWSESVEVYWARGSQIVAAPVAPDELCVAVTSRDPHLKFADALSQIPALASRLRSACASDRVRGARTALRRLKRVCRGRVALVGDASGSVDPLTGEGIGLALQQAAALVEAIKRDDLQDYQAAHDLIGRVPHLMSRVLLLMDAHPFLRRRALRALAVEPLLFSRLLNVQLGEPANYRRAFSLALRLGWLCFRPWDESMAEPEPIDRPLDRPPDRPADRPMDCPVDRPTDWID